MLWIPALFVTNKSLWVDELLLALNFIEQDWSHLLHPLDYRQMAPIGFLLATKCFAILFDNQDFAFKILPAFAWFASWFLFKKTLEFFKVSSLILWGTMALFSSNFILLSYSYEFKQYSTDVFFSLTIYYFYLLIQDKKQILPWLKFGFILGISILFSNIAIVIMAALALIAFISDGKKFFSSFFFKTLIFQAIIFLLYYTKFLYQHPTEGYMLQYWKSKNAFFPSPNGFSFLIHKTQIILNIVFNNKYIGLLIILISTSTFFVKGKFSFFRLQNISFIILFSHLILSALNKYPFENRFILYIIPFILISLACGFYKTEESIFFDKKKHFIFSVVTSASLLLAIIYGQMKNIQDLLNPKEDIKSLMAEIENRSESIDYLYISEGAEVGFLYYRHFYPKTMQLSFGLANSSTSLPFSNKNFSNITLLLSHYSPFDTKEQDFENKALLDAKRNGYDCSNKITSERSVVILCKKKLFP
ncbi:MAG: hypothetical protein RLY35_1115 [Bacteroidota bacterium]|jgi:hypothetical protein